MPEWLAERLATNANGSAAFDIVVYYTALAMKVSQLMKQQMAVDPPRYDRMQDDLRKASHLAMQALEDAKEVGFHRIFNNGDLYYDPVVVQIMPNDLGSSFAVSLSTH